MPFDIELLKRTAKEHGDNNLAAIQRRTQLTWPTVYRTLNGLTKPTVPTIHALGKPYGLTVDNLWPDRDEAASNVA